MMETAGHIVALRTRLQWGGGGCRYAASTFVHVFDVQFENAAQLFNASGINKASSTRSHICNF
ncbi:hypothetical protein FQN60_005315 [Etheostoma spectabile]|uniref:Uncharacterized protein n=1 Tax=Etheostoma spectabile TaxID=54343 RepID=A0A5J5CA64_9PERO|nr:hypothetical protein FQN60_005315 [Etheostoma spectabile]